MKKDVVAGLGEIGSPILKLLSKKYNIVGFDIDKKLMKKIKSKKSQKYQTSFLQIIHLGAMYTSPSIFVLEPIFTS